MLEGTVTELLLLESVILQPVAGAKPDIATVPVDLVPPVMVDALSVKSESFGDWIDKEAVTDFEPRVALIVELVFAATGFVVIEKFAAVAPLATVTEVGTVADVLELPNTTTLPPVGAFVDNVMVPVALPPPTTDDGVTVSLLTDCAFAEWLKSVKKMNANAKGNPPFSFDWTRKRLFECCNLITAYEPTETFFSC